MKKTKYILPVLTTMYVLTLKALKENEKNEILTDYFAGMISLIEYLFYECFESNTNLLILSTIGFNYWEIKEQCLELLKQETKYKDKRSS